MKKLLFILTLLSACQQQETEANIDWQGHRGARAVYPENTIPAFKYALETGVKTLEMDVVITADSMVVLSHEPYMSAEICFHSHAGSFDEEQARAFNIYQMTYEQVKQFDCGSKNHPRFPGQKKVKVHKPLLAQVIMTAEAMAIQQKRALPYYNIEIKSRSEWDTVYHPEIPAYADLVIEVIKAYQVNERSYIQSFDKRALRYIHQSYPDIKLVLLVEDKPDFRAEIEELGFEPEVYSCYYPLVNEEMVFYCREKGIKLIPWTVNQEEDISALIKMGVDGIITDDPILLMKF